MRQPIDASRRPLSGLRTERPVGAGATSMKADSMKTVGLWIDHTKASIVAETDHGEVTTQILSKVEKRVRPAPMGRAYRYQRRLAHIVIKVAEKGSEG